MAGRFNTYAAAWGALVLLGLHVVQPSTAPGDMLDSLCSSETDSAVVMQSIVEEAEATGMPPSTLNRLLIKGYQTRDSVATLSRLLCAIVLAEEAGLPPAPLFRKLDEGLGKRAPLSRIVEVVQAKVDDMKFIQTLVSGEEEPRLEDDNVERLANTLSAGLTKEELKSLFDLVYDDPVGMRVVAAEIKAYGRAIGFSEPLLDQINASGLASQSFTDDWSFFVKVASSARKQNISFHRISAQAVKVLGQKGSLADLSESLGLP